MRADAAMLGAPVHARVENDFYGTIDLGCTHALLNFFEARGQSVRNKRVWEPASGQGHISNVCRFFGADVTESDIAPQTVGAAVMDFTTVPDTCFDDATNTPHFIITNPPYQRDVIDAFLTKCAMFTRDYGITCAMLMRNEVDSAVTRRKFFADCKQFDAKLTLLWRPRWIADSTGSPRHNYAWFIWSPAAGNRAAELHHAIKPKL